MGEGMVEIEFRKFRDVDLRGGAVIDGFPGVGLASIIAANYLVDVLKLDQVCALESEAFPPVSMVYARKPKFPARIYANEKHKIAVFLTEFTPKPELFRPLARQILSWTMDQKATRIVSPEALPMTDTTGREPQVVGVGATDKSRASLEKAGIPQMDVGLIAGVSGVLMNEARWHNVDAVCLLAEARPDIPDAKSAAKILEAIDKLLPEVELDLTPLYEKAGQLEKHVKKLREQAKPVTEEPQYGMYG